MNDNIVFVHSSVQTGPKLCDYVNNIFCFKDRFTFFIGDNGLSPGNEHLHVTLK